MDRNLPFIILSTLVVFIIFTVCFIYLINNLSQQMLDKVATLAFVLLVIITGTLFIIKPTDKTAQQQFQKFKFRFRKTYANQDEQNYRRAIFNQNMLEIENHNANKSNSYSLGVTYFTDFIQQEFIQKMLITTFQDTLDNTQTVVENQVEKDNVMETNIDWVSLNKVSAVKNQGLCGSCWAFSSTGAVQSLYSIQKNKNSLLSEQQLVDCSSSYGNNGCSGGIMNNAFNYIKDKGLTQSSKYPYSGRPQKCLIDSGDFKINGFINASGCTALYNAILKKPVSVGVDASSWALYNSGIFRACGTNINHGVLLVGVNQSYWKIKNSWGVSWGQNGYIRLARGNTCGVCSIPSYPSF